MASTKRNILLLGALLLLVLTACGDVDNLEGSYLYETPDAAIAGPARATGDSLTVELLDSGLVLKGDEAKAVKALSEPQYQTPAYEDIREVLLFSRTPQGGTPPKMYIKVEELTAPTASPQGTPNAEGTPAATETPDEQVEGENGEPGFFERLLDQVGSGGNWLYELPIPLLSVAMMIAAYWIVFKPLRAFILKVEAPRTMDVKVPQLSTGDGFEIPEFDLQVQYAPQLDPDARQRFASMGIGRVEEIVRQATISWLTDVVSTTTIANVQTIVAQACSHIRRGQEGLEGSDFKFSEVGITVHRVQSGGVNLTDEQEELRSARTAAKARGAYYREVVEAAGPNAGRFAGLAEVFRTLGGGNNSPFLLQLQDLFKLTDNDREEGGSEDGQ